MSFSFDRIPILVRSRYALIYLVTHEERRVEERLRDSVAAEGVVMMRWRATTGLLGPDDEPVEGTREPSQALKHILGVPDPGVFLMADFHVAMEDPMVVRLLRDLEPVLSARSQAIVIVSPILVTPPELEKDLTVLDVPLPNQQEVASLLDEVALGDEVELQPEVKSLLARSALGLTGVEIRRMFHKIRLSGGTLGPDVLPEIIAEKRRTIRQSQFLEFWDDPGTMEDVGGMDTLKAWLGERSAAFGEEARKFGLPTPKGLFLLGVQGCGKSLMAKAVAGFWQVPLLRFDVAALFQAASSIEAGFRDTIRVAESLSPVVLWIDELEKGFLATEQGAGARALGTFLTWMQEKTRPVFVVATANEIRMLPPELLRKGRFDEIFFVDLPNPHERLAILEIHLRRRNRDPLKMDLTAVAEESERFSGAELEQVVVAALFHAFSMKREVQAEDLLQVVRDTVPLAITMDDRLKELREWARPRARRASEETRRVDFFEIWAEEG